MVHLTYFSHLYSVLAPEPESLAKLIEQAKLARLREEQEVLTRASNKTAASSLASTSNKNKSGGGEGGGAKAQNSQRKK